MTTDRELLEAAAKAAGYRVIRSRLNAGRQDLLIVRGSDDVAHGWNPLTRIEDATSLLLLLKLRVDYVGDQPCIDGVLQHGMTAEESFCRAVVRAAAATLKEKT